MVRMRNRMIICILNVCFYVTEDTTTTRAMTSQVGVIGGFQSQFEAFYMSNHTEELWYNETVCQWMTIYAPSQELSTLT